MNRSLANASESSVAKMNNIEEEKMNKSILLEKNLLVHCSKRAEKKYAIARTIKYEMTKGKDEVKSIKES